MSSPSNPTAPLKLVTPVFRGSYVYLTKPRINKNKPDEPGKFQMVIVLPKNKPETKEFIKKLEKLFVTTMTEKFGKAIPFTACKHYPIKDGDLPNEDGEVNEAHAGCWTISASNKFKPQALTLQGEEIIDADELYSGAWYRASIGAYAWKHESGGKGVSVDLKNVLKVKDDTRFGGGGNAKDDFAEFIGEDAPATDDNDII
ncbi:hypothetical protein [Caudoviricetes sp.]|nr:hypothetical protein [Caudoviricetes sp.]